MSPGTLKGANTGHDINTDLGQAHESVLRKAEIGEQLKAVLPTGSRMPNPPRPGWSPPATTSTGLRTS